MPGYGEPPRDVDIALPVAASGQSGGLAGVVAGGVRGGGTARCPRVAVRRLRRLPLVSRHGARVVRGRGDRHRDERQLRQREGRPGRATRRRRGLHGSHPGHDRARRLADDRVLHARRGALLLRHLLPAAAAARHAVVRPGARRRRRGLARPPRAGPRGWSGRDSAPLIAVDPAQRRRASYGRPAGHRGAGASAGLRLRARRLRRRSEVPTLDGARVPSPAPRSNR